MTIASLFGIELPIIQAPMAGSQGAELALAVTAAGGLGSLPCALLTPDALAHELATLRARQTGPVNVNFFCHEVAERDEAALAAWRTRLARYYDELGIAPPAASPGPARQPFDDAFADVLESTPPAVVSFHFGLPRAALLARIKRWGTRVLATATTLEEARALEERGVDAIIAQGSEAGGHRGMFLSTDLTRQVGTLALVPQLVHAVKVPVIAAGGIADAAGVAAAMTLGAAGVQVGTAYLLCPEATTAPLHRTALQSDRAHHTVITNVLTGRPARTIGNRVVRELGPIAADAPAFPSAAEALAPLRQAAEARGRDDFTPLWAGQNTSGCRAVPAAELTRALAARL
jgi:nitronate monooxygenase